MTHQEPEPDAPRPRPAVELEPLVKRAEAPRYVAKAETALGHGGDYGKPVPENPLHMCPECDYCLTGLTSRRCPECGTPFTLVGARRHAISLLPNGKLDIRAVRFQRIAFYVGLGLLVFGTFGPMLTLRNLVTLSIFLLIIEAGIVFMFVYMWKVYYQKTWADAMLLAGATVGTIGAIVMLS